MSKTIPALYMRGGTSKGVFFLSSDLPADPGERDALLLRVIGSPDPFGTQMDGMGGATSSTSKVAVIGPSSRPGCDVDYLFGAVAVDRPVIDWSGNCGNLSSAVGPFAIHRGLVRPAAADGLALVRIWQANIGARILARVPVRGGRVVEDGDFLLDGVAFPSAAIGLEFLDPSGGEEGGGGRELFPTGARREFLDLGEEGRIEATLVNSGTSAVLVRAADLGLGGTELPVSLNADRGLLARLEGIRAAGAVAMGLAASPGEATRNRPHTPKLAFLSPPSAYLSTAGAEVGAGDMDLCARMLSMGKLHHALPATGAIAIAVAAAVPGTIASELTRPGREAMLRIGHPAGLLPVGAEASEEEGRWVARRVIMVRSARILMSGEVHLPG